MELNHEQYQNLLRMLQRDYDFKDHTKSYMSRGVCPSCKKRELFISCEKPYRLCCNRRNHCGFSVSTFELYKSELFTNWSKNYQASEENPNASADAYMCYARGFEFSKVNGLYRQEYYAKDDKATATVRFTLSDGKAQWERFIDNVERFVGQKGRALSSYKGLWWQMPDEDFTQDEIFITEGIFDALSLIHAGKCAIACISSGHYPSGFFAHLRAMGRNPKIIFALDSDTAGKSAAQKHYHKAKQEGFNVAIALPPQGSDWNDLWRNHQLSEHQLKEAFYQGALLVAGSAAQKAYLMYQHSGMSNFPLTYEERTYWFALDVERYQSLLDELNQQGEDEAQGKHIALEQASKVTEIANCHFEPLYFQRARDGEDSRYFMRISRANMASVQDTFSGGQMGSASDFKKRLLSIYPGALYEGNSKQLDRIIKEKFTHLRIVESIDFCGYVRDLDAWVYRDFAIKNGKVLKTNAQQFIEIDKHHSIKTLSDVHITYSDKPCDFSWVSDFWQGFGEKGMVALTFFTGSLFVDTIRQNQQSWPFLEMTGEAGTGKTTLLEFLWRLHGREDYEGFDPNKTSFAGRARTFNKVSGLPVVLIEGDHHASHNRKFEFGEIKDLFNGRPIYTRAVKTSGMETNDPSFKGSVVIAQNDRIEADEAVLSRIIPLFFSRKNIPEGGKRHVDALNRLSTEHLSPYLVHMLCQAQSLLSNYFELFPSVEAKLARNELIVMARIVHNGAQIMSMFLVIAKIMKLSEEMIHNTMNYIEEICVLRQQSFQSDHPMVSEFFDTFEYLEGVGGTLCVNHSLDDDLIAINLVHFESVAKSVGISTPPKVELNRLLLNAKRYQYLGRRSVRSKIFQSKVTKCIVFKLEKAYAKTTN